MASAGSPSRSSQDEEELYQHNKDMIEKDMVYLTRRLQTRDFICRLREKHIFDFSDQEEIESRYYTTIERARLMIDKVFLKGPAGIEAFLTILEFDYGDCYMKVTKKQPRPKPKDWSARSLRRENTRSRTLEISKALTLVTQVLDNEVQQRVKHQERLKEIIDQHEEELLESQQQLDIKQEDITNALRENMELKKRVAGLEVQLEEASEKRCQYIEEFFTEKKMLEAAVRDSAGCETIQIPQGKDLLAELIAQRNTFKKENSLYQKEIRDLKDKLERVEESHAALNQIYYEKPFRKDTVSNSLPKYLSGPPCRHEDAMHVSELLICDELSQWNQYHSAFTDTTVKMDASELRLITIAGGNFCGLFVDAVPDDISKLRQGEAIIEIQNGNDRHKIDGLIKEDALKLFDKLDGMVSITKRVDQGNHYYSSLNELISARISGGDCFCVNIMKNYNDTSADLQLEGGMIILVTDTVYNAGVSNPSTPTTPVDEAIPIKGRWCGEVMSPADGKRTGRKGLFLSLTGFKRGGVIGSRQRTSREQSFAMSKFRYVMPHRALYKRPVVILSAEEHHVHLVDCLRDAKEVFFEEEEPAISTKKKKVPTATLR